MIDFPESPTIGTPHTVGSKSWRWNGYAWDLTAISDAQVQTAVDAAAAAVAAAATASEAAAFSDVNAIAKNAADNSKQWGVDLSALAASQFVKWTVRALNGTVALLSDLVALILPTTYYNSGTTNALNLANGGHQRWAPNTGAQTLTITGWAAAGTRSELLIEGVNLGAATITWPTIQWIKFDGSLTTTFSANGITLRTSGVDNVVLWTRDGGTTIYGKVIR